MKFQKQISVSVQVMSGGFTLIEVLVASVVSMVVIAAVVSLSLISAQNFVATSNYAAMDYQSRNALDRISREIRNATSLAAFSMSNPQFLRLTNVNNASGATVTYDSGPRTLTLTQAGQPSQMLLTNCNAFSFQLFNRYPDIQTSTNLSFHGSTNVTGQVTNLFCKVINMSWKCSRPIVGSKLSTEIVQTAQVVLRNQVSE